MLQIISNMIEAHIFRIKKNKIEFLLLKRSENEIYPGLWQMVSGSIHNHETAYQTALREIMEETELRPTKMWIVPNINSFYSPEKNYIFPDPKTSIFLFILANNFQMSRKFLTSKKLSHIFNRNLT